MVHRFEDQGWVGQWQYAKGMSCDITVSSCDYIAKPDTLVSQACVVFMYVGIAEIWILPKLDSQLAFWQL